MRENVARLDGLPHAGDKSIAIVCFVIAPGFRRQGAATRLLGHVLADYARRGFDVVEAWPRKDGKTAAD